MNQSELITATLARLIEVFQEAAHANASAIETGRHRVANRALELLVHLAGEIRRRGTQGEMALLQLLQSNDSQVRLWAASYSLDFSPVEAEEVLTELSAGPPSLGRLTAEMTLRDWRERRE